jgi:hypothetical protein
VSAGEKKIVVMNDFTDSGFVNSINECETKINFKMAALRSHFPGFSHTIFLFCLAHSVDISVRDI